MKNNLPEGILASIETLAKTTSSYHAVMNLLKQNTDMLVLLSDPLVSKLSVLDSALTRGLFNENLAQSVSKLLVPYYELIGIQVASVALGYSFKEMLKSEMYTSAKAMSVIMKKHAQTIEEFQVDQSTRKVLIQATPNVDTSWVKISSAWLVKEIVIQPKCE